MVLAMGYIVGYMGDARMTSCFAPLAQLVLFSELSPLATVDEDKAVKTSLKENLVELLRSTPERALKLLK